MKNTLGVILVASLLILTACTAMATPMPNPPTLTPNPPTPTNPPPAATSGECQPVMANPLQPSSPDENWSVYDCPESELLITNADGSKAWYLGHNLFLPNTKNVGLERWSSDSQYVYLKGLDVNGMPGGLRPMIDQLWRFNVETGEYFNIFANIAVAAGTDYPASAAISFSSDEKTLLVIDQRHVVPPIVYIYDLEKNRFVQSFRLAGSENSVTVGTVVWSPDQHYFATTSASGGEFETYGPGQTPKDWSFSVIVFDLEKMTQKAIITERKGFLIGLRKITDENVLMVESSRPARAYGEKRDLTREQYDLIKGQFLTLTPTP